MRKEQINKDVAINLDAVNADGYCPHCGDQHFTNKIKVVKKQTHKVRDNGVYINECVGCGKTSVHREGKQYKKA